MSIFEGLCDYFRDSDDILYWPHTFGVSPIEKWDFDSEVKNYDFAPLEAEVGFCARMRLFFETDVI